MIKPMLKIIVKDFKVESGNIDVRAIGIASRYLELNQNTWPEFGKESDIFQYLKQLWYVVVQYG